MSHTITIAAVQMEATPAPKASRLERAEKLIIEAAESGAQMVILPEFFNLGYTYDPSNYYRAEPLNGPTVFWMKNLAVRLNIYLAGTILLLERSEIYNSMLLFGPKGEMWRYDKNYPWGWERGFFRGRENITIAETEFGRIGMLICWDVGHLDMWRRYAGEVDLMLISSCPPDVSNPTYSFPNGDRITVEDMGPLVSRLKNSGKELFGPMIEEQTAWLGVPAVSTMGSGEITTQVPNGLGTILSILPAAPWLAKYLPQAREMKMTCQMIPGCKIINGAGEVISEVNREIEESFTLAKVVLPNHTTQPLAPQPRSRLPLLSYWLSDKIWPWLTKPLYRRGTRQVWGDHMAPTETPPKSQIALFGVGLLIAFWLGRLFGRASKK